MEAFAVISVTCLGDEVNVVVGYKTDESVQYPTIYVTKPFYLFSCLVRAMSLPLPAVRREKTDQNSYEVFDNQDPAKEFNFIQGLRILPVQRLPRYVLFQCVINIFGFI